MATQTPALVLLAAGLSAAAIGAPKNAPGWDRDKAFEYLEARQQQWADWKPAKKAGGACISCHTGLSYLIARRVVGEAQPLPQEKALAEGVKHRVLANPPQTMLADPGAEAILNLLTLALQRRDAKQQLSTAEELALKRLWEAQNSTGDEKGAFSWFQNDLHPVESEHSIFYGTVLAHMAVSAYGVPESHQNFAALRDYLRRNAAQQPLHNRLGWIALDGAADAAARKSVLAGLWSAQAKDGGWTMKSIGPWSARPDAPPDSESNAYATAWAAFTARESGVKCGDANLKRALAWLKEHQNPATGAWDTKSPNKVFPAGSMPEKFMTDAATGYAAAALAACPGN